MTREQLEELASLAEASRQHLASVANHTDALPSLIEEADLAFAIWNDPTAPHGVDVAIIKGKGRLILISQGQRSVPSKVTAVPCRTREEAEAMRLVFGDGRAEDRNS
jgi:hypothetical protein